MAVAGGAGSSVFNVENERHSESEFVRSGREIIHIQVGKSGNMVGHEFWRDLCAEHNVETDGTDMAGHIPQGSSADRMDVFFNQGSRHSSTKQPRWVPRCILVDTNMQDLAQLASDGLGALYRPENIIGNDEGSGNCYAKAFHTEGPDLADRCLEVVRKEVERCECLQGVQFTHSVSGGTGSGLVGLLVKTLSDYLDTSKSKCIIQTWTLVPGVGTTDILLEPYNACLALQDLHEIDQVFCFDNSALQDICQKHLEMDQPKMQQLNNIIALCMSGLTSCLRFSGALNADLRKLNTNLVPFRKANFLINGFAPLTSAASKGYRATANVRDLAQQMMSKDSVTVKCDPLNPGDPSQNIRKARFLASWASWRGSWLSQEVDEVHYWLQKEGSRYDKYFPDWIPNAIGSNICRQPHCDLKDSVTFVSNSTAIHEVFDRLRTSWGRLFDKKAYLHVFEQDGISQEDMLESSRVMEYISAQYCMFADKKDKFLEKPGMPGGRPGIKEDAIENGQQRQIAEWCQDLAGDDEHGAMYIRPTGGKLAR